MDDIPEDVAAYLKTHPHTDLDPHIPLHLRVLRIRMRIEQQAGGPPPREAGEDQVLWVTWNKSAFW